MNLVKRFFQVLKFKGTVLLVFIIIALTFIFQNSEEIDVNFLFWTFVQVPKLYLILICLGVGILIGSIFTYGYLKLRKQ